VSRYNPAALYMRTSIQQELKGIWDYPLTLVEAPMGYGKTTAVKEYLSDSGANVYWQTIASESVNSFWQEFSRLFSRIDAKSAVGLMGLGAPDNSLYAETALQLIHGIEFPDRSVVVLDDYHLLSEAKLDRFIELLARNLPPNLHLVIISRAMFGETAMGTEHKAYCHAIDKSSFELTQEEIGEYYKLCGIRLKASEAAALYEYTEGWISALYLSMLSFLREGRVEQQASLQELIEKVVYRQCPAEVKEFLLTLCVFDKFSLTQAKEMWSAEKVEAALKYLMANNAFIKYDSYSQTYHMHNILTTYLRELLERQGTPKKHAVLRLAAAWYIKNGDYLKAMDCFEAVGDFDELFTALELDNANSIYMERKEILKGYFIKCPVEIKRKHPIAGLVFARKMFSFNERALYTAQCQEVGDYINEIHDVKTRNQLLGELELIKSFARYNDIEGMAGHQRKAYELLDGPTKLFDNKSFWTFGSPSILYMYYRKSGRVAQEVKDLLAFMPLYGQITSGHGAGAEYVMQAEWHFYRGEFEQADLGISAAMEPARFHRQISILLCALFLQTRLAFVRGDLPAVQNFLRQMRSEIEAYGQYQVVHTVDMCEAQIYAQLNTQEKIPAWIAAGKIQESRLHFPSHAYFNIIYGKSLLISGQYLKLLGLAGHFNDTAGIFPNLLGQVYTHIYVAVARYRLQHLEEAQESLKKALDIAAPDQLLMPFVENGEYIQELFAKLDIDEQHTKFIDCIRTAYAAYAKNVAIMRTAEEQDAPLSRLSARELEIAELVANGLLNQGIAARLYIGVTTVKKTLQNIYAKLGITRRTELMRMVLERKRGK